MKSISLAELTQLKEGFDLEAKQATGRDGRGELPVSFFESYSAMANTDGGVVLLGVKEKGHVFEVIGVPDVERVHRALWDGLNNRERVSANLLSNASVELLKIEGKSVIEVRVPRATRQQRPVFVGKNPLGGTFIRNHEGDYRCPDEVVTRMLADKVEESRDSRILYHHDFDDLDATSFSRYRNHFKSKKPDHPWNGEDDREFLRLIGGWRRERETKKAGLTAAGLLMFGRYPEIREVFPFFMLDYQERPEARADSRWVDRVTPDGTWSGNLFDFYQIVIQRLVRDLKVPFRLTGDTRVDESPVHEALREALVNTLIHADYSGRASVLVVYAPESGNPWTAAVLVRAFLSKFRRKEIVSFGVAYTCSKMRPDEFSGEDFIVTADGIVQTGGIGIKMCEALAAQQQQRIKWDGLDIIIRPRKVNEAAAQRGIEAGKEGEVG